MSLSVTPFALLTPLLLLLLGGGQLCLWRMWRDHRELAWLGAGLMGVGLGVLLQLTWRPFSLPLFVLGFSSCYVVGFACIGQALAQRLCVPLRHQWALALIALGLSLQAWFSMVHPDMEIRLYIINTVALSFLLLPLWHWHRMRIRNMFDEAVRWVTVGFIASMAFRLVVLLPLAHVNQSENYNQSWLWLGMHVLGTVSGMLIAAAMFFAVLWDVLGKMQVDRQLDPLTKILNRRGFEEQTKQKMAATRPTTWALLVCDLDHFKSVNDTWGHVAGDRVLHIVADILQKQVRAGDLVARFGGEEFVVLLEGDAQTALRVAERIRQQVAQCPMPELKGGHVTVSIGGAFLAELSEQGIASAFTQADAMLYVAKRSGRDRVAMPSSTAPASQ